MGRGQRGSGMQWTPPGVLEPTRPFRDSSIWNKGAGPWYLCKTSHGALGEAASLAGSNSKQRFHCEASLVADGKMNLLVLGRDLGSTSQPSLQRCESDLDYQAWQFLQRKTSLQLLSLAQSRPQRLGSQWPRRSPWPGSAHQTPRDSSHVGQANLRLKRTVHLLKFYCLD